MNIFVLDNDPKIAASMMCNKHVCKMIIESGQILSTVHWLTHLDRVGGPSRFKKLKDAKSWLDLHVTPGAKPAWKMTHIHHPSVKWAMEGSANYQWLWEHMGGLLAEYTKRYKKSHKSEVVHSWLGNNRPNIKSQQQITPHPKCMPDEIRLFCNDTVKAYRLYYILHKAKFAKWEPHTREPEWWPKDTENAEV
jgi:hypothetical protein